MKRLCVFAFVLVLAVPVLAKEASPLTLEEVRDTAESIFIGRVMSSSVRPVLNGSYETTDYLIQVSEVLYGAVGAKTTVSYFGSEKFRVDDVPRLVEGQEYLFFRTPQPTNTTVGWDRGLFALESAIVKGVQQTIIVSGTGIAVMNAGGTLSFGDKIFIRDGQIQVDSTISTPEPKSTNARSESGGVRLLPAQPRRVAMKAPGTYATLDDLRTFVRLKSAAKSR